MSIRISKADGIIRGRIRLIASKSISNRLLIIRALCKNAFEIRRLSSASDTILLEKLLKLKSHSLNVEDAGTALRFLTAFLANNPGEWQLTGNDRMKMRPVGPLVDALNELGSQINYLEKEGFPPLFIRGKLLTGGKITLDASLSSQFVSAMLLIAPCIKGGLRIELNEVITSHPYIEMTLGLMNYFGIQYERSQQEIRISEQQYTAKDILVESDWSAAAFWFEQAALSEETDLFIDGLEENSLQGDSIIAEWMKDFGINTEFELDGVRIRKSKNSKIPAHVEKSFLDHPDLFPAMACVCSGLGIPARFSGVKNLRIKESDRLFDLKNELNKFGVVVSIDDSGNVFEIHNFVLSPPDESIETHDDHRIAMAIASLTMRAGPLRIENEKVVLKSYPGFWNDLMQVGYNIES